MLIYLPTGRRELIVKLEVAAFNLRSVVTNLCVDLRYKLY